MSSGTAPTGGHTDRSALGRTDPGRSTPSACSNQPDPASARENTDTARAFESSSAPPTITRTATEPPSGNTSGAARFNSSTTPQSTSQPARIASSTNPAPGNRTTPPPARAASQP